MVHPAQAWGLPDEHDDSGQCSVDWLPSQAPGPRLLERTYFSGTVGAWCYLPYLPLRTEQDSGDRLHTALTCRILQRPEVGFLRVRRQEESGKGLGRIKPRTGW